MTCEELKQEYAAYALGIADEPERSEIREHLERGCTVCVPGVADAMSTVTAMSGAVRLSDPPKQLRQRVAALVMPPPARRPASLLPWLITGLVSLALVLVSLPARRPASDLARLETAVSILNDPAARDIAFGETEKPARGRVFVSPRGVVLMGTGMPRLAAGRVFEMWLIPASGNPVAAGTFVADADSTAVYVHPFAAGNASEVAVTVEPQGGSPQPTTTPFIVARL